MGSYYSKVEVSVPPQPTALPVYEEEEEFDNALSKIEECHQQAIKLSSWLVTTFCPSFAQGKLAFTAASYLLTFLIHRLRTGGPELPSSPDQNGLFSSLRRGGSRLKKQKGLEEALMELKISEALATQAVSELEAKLYMLQKRVDRLAFEELKLEERKLEIVPAVMTCEQILQLFNNPQHVFRSQPLHMAPYINALSGVFHVVARHTLSILPSYGGSLMKEMKLLKDTIEIYKKSCIEARIKALRLKPVHPENMLSAVSGNIEWNRYRLEDSFAAFKSDVEDKAAQEPIRTFGSANEAVEAYTKEIEVLYENMFRNSLQNISEFIGLEKEKVGETVQQNHTLDYHANGNGVFKFGIGRDNNYNNEVVDSDGSDTSTLTGRE